jgi:hypothetical protein
MKITKQQILDYIKENWIDATWNQYNYDMWGLFYEINNNFNLDFDIDCCENSSDTWLQATTYVNNLIWLNWYNIIIDVDVENNFGNNDEFVDEVIRLQEIAEKIQNNFISLKK